MTSLEFRRDFWRQKTRVPGLSNVVVCVIIGLAVLVEHQLVKDGQTDIRTHDDGKYRASIASRGKMGHVRSFGSCFVTHRLISAMDYLCRLMNLKILAPAVSTT